LARLRSNEEIVAKSHTQGDNVVKDVSRRTLTAGDRERADIILALGQLLKAWMTSRSESNWKLEQGSQAHSQSSCLPLAMGFLASISKCLSMRRPLPTSFCNLIYALP
jgi:hypothetical protein